MPYRRGRGSQTAPAAPAADDEEAFRLVAIRPAKAPEGCVGRDWLVYEIAQGTNKITGYRRGDLASATADVQKIISGLNERRISKKGRQPPPRPSNAPSRVAPAATVASDAEDA